MKSPVEAIREKKFIGSADKKMGIKEEFRITRLEGMKGFRKDGFNIPLLADYLRTLINLYPNFDGQLSQILDDCTHRYQFSTDLKNIEEFKSELMKYSIDSEKLGKLLLTADEKVLTEKETVYDVLYNIYKRDGAQSLQDRIDSLQNLEWYDFAEAMIGGPKDKPLIKAKDPITELKIPHWSEIKFESCDIDA